MTKDEVKAFDRMVRRFYKTEPKLPYSNWPTIQDALRYAFDAGLKRERKQHVCMWTS